jgi:hypothetical protein
MFLIRKAHTKIRMMLDQDGKTHIPSQGPPVSFYGRYDPLYSHTKVLDLPSLRSDSHISIIVQGRI